MKYGLASFLIAAFSAAPALAQLSISDAYMRQPAPGQVNGAIYMQVENQGDSVVRIVAASSDVADRTELHEHAHADGMMRMRKVAALEIEAGSRVAFRPHGNHLMLFDLSRMLQPGDRIGFCLVDEGSEEHCAEAIVNAPGE